MTWFLVACVVVLAGLLLIEWRVRQFADVSLRESLNRHIHEWNRERQMNTGVHRLLIQDLADHRKLLDTTTATVEGLAGIVSQQSDTMKLLAQAAARRANAPDATPRPDVPREIVILRGLGVDREYTIRRGKNGKPRIIRPHGELRNHYRFAGIDQATQRLVYELSIKDGEPV